MSSLLFRRQVERVRGRVPRADNCTLARCRTGGRGIVSRTLPSRPPAHVGVGAQASRLRPPQAAYYGRIFIRLILSIENFDLFIDIQAKVLDGIDTTEYFLGEKLNDDEDTLTQMRPIFYYCNRKIMAVRYKHYKVHVSEVVYKIQKKYNYLVVDGIL